MKLKYPFNPDTYLGHRGADELETVTGALHFSPAAFCLCSANTSRDYYTPEMLLHVRRQPPVGVVFCGPLRIGWL